MPMSEDPEKKVVKKTSHPRFKYHATIVIKDRLFGSTMLLKTNAAAPTIRLLINNFNVKSKESIQMMDQPHRVTQKAINELIEGLRQEKMSNKKIHNHFAKYGIDVYLPDDKKPPRLHKWQKTLEDCE
jgi:hypothetical protein